MFFQQLTGINMIMFFAGALSIKLVKDNTLSVFIGASNFLATLVAFFCVDSNIF